ncbi:MAG: hypothetical protein ACI30M_01310 [Muribaculaceae bacterium]
MKNTNFKQNIFETEVNCPEKALNFTTEPLQGSMMVYSGHCPHTKCRRHFSVGLTTNRSLRDLAPMCLRHNGAPRLMSHSSVYCSDQASSLRSLPGLSHDSMLSEPAGYGKPAWCSMNKTHDSGTFGSAGQVNAMQECSPMRGMCLSRPSLSKARYKDSLDYHRVRSLRDLAPRCLRHFSVGFGSSLCRQRAPALCADAH